MDLIGPSVHLSTSSTNRQRFGPNPWIPWFCVKTKESTATTLVVIKVLHSFSYELAYEVEWGALAAASTIVPHEDAYLIVGGCLIRRRLVHCIRRRRRIIA